MMAQESQKEEYTIYFNEDGLLQKTVINMYLEAMVINTITTEYEYDDVPTITPPANADAFSQR